MVVPKFRAWLKAEKQMIDVEFLDLSHKVLIGRHWEFGMTEAIKFDDVEIMQYTGLMDSSSPKKEIVVGDIVEYEDGEYDDIFYSRGIVEFIQGGINITNRACVMLDDLLDGGTLEVKVIGNIYENPELVEEVGYGN